MISVNIDNMFAAGSLISRSGLVLALVFYFTACSSIHSPGPEELARINNPPDEVVQKLEILAPLTLEWFEQIESQYLHKGRTLTLEEQQMARSIGVASPEKVRVIVLKHFPHPANTTLKLYTRNYGMGASSEAGRTMGNVIMLKAKRQDERELLAYELVHIAQQEKLGRQAYVRRFITEYELVGRDRSPLELDAHKIALEFEQ